MLELKADGPAELKLLELLLPSGAQVSLTGSSVPAATQQQLDNLNYVIKAQQAQLAQAQAEITEYQQAIAALTGQSPQLLLPPAAPTDSGLAVSETPRRYITGGLGQGQSKAITAQTQTAPTFEPSHYRSLSALIMGCQRLMKPSLVLMLFCLVAWGVFQYVAPAIGNRLLHTPTEPTPEQKKASEPKPQSNLDDSDTTPGSAAGKAGTQPNALDL